jgi:hypothetical protein
MRDTFGEACFSEQRDFRGRTKEKRKEMPVDLGQDQVRVS